MAYHFTTLEKLVKKTGNQSCTDYIGHQADAEV